MAFSDTDTEFTHHPMVHCRAIVRFEVVVIQLVHVGAGDGWTIDVLGH